MAISEAIEAAGAIVDRFPNGGYRAGDGYIGSLASTLMSFPRSVAQRCADFPIRPGAPLQGICKTAKFLPVPADLIEWCEREAASLHDDAARQARIAAAQTLRDAGGEGSRLSYAELKQKYPWPEPAAQAPRGLSTDDLIKICGAEAWAKIPDAKV